ncbi:hypothetical protein [Actinophytocola sp.]|uniref:hypothetical protein n=1 Tax=Actinophytocola sp. TaxID=1872138 RepID=UPI00389AD31F
MPSFEQLRRHARALRRAVRAGTPVARRLVDEHGWPALDTASFTLANARHLLARYHGFAGWAQLRRHVEAGVGPENGVLTVDDRFRVRRGWASPDDLARIGADGWAPLFTARHRGVRVVAFATAGGPVFAELTPTTVTVSRPGGGDGLTFHTALGTLAGVVPAGTASVAVERPADRAAREPAVVADGVFAVPNAFVLDENGLVLRLDGADRGRLVPREALPDRADGVVDRPAPAAERDSPEGRRLGAALATAPVVDADQWVPGAFASLGGGESIQLGSYRGLLLWHLTGEVPFVFDFSPGRGPVRDFAVVGETVALTRVYHGFAGGTSDRVVLAGVVDRDRVASVTFHRADGTALPATLGGDTLLVTAPDLTAPRERGPVRDRVVARDPAGAVVEDLPYQEGG